MNRDENNLDETKELIIEFDHSDDEAADDETVKFDSIGSSNVV